MTLWLLLALDFLAQEPVSSSVLLSSVYQQHYNLWAVHALFVAATAVDACVGYWIGSALRRKFSHSWIGVRLTERAEWFRSFAGKYGRRATLLFWSPTIFPYSALIAPWFGYTFTENLVLSLVGDTILWYVSEWLIVLGVKTLVPNPLWSLYMTAGVALAVVLIAKYLFTKYSRFERSS